jgi:hypothetical protein
MSLYQCSIHTEAVKTNDLQSQRLTLDVKVRPQGPTGLKVSRMEVVVDIVLVVLLVLVLVLVSEMGASKKFTLFTYGSRDFHPILFHFIPHPLSVSLQ